MKKPNLLNFTKDVKKVMVKHSPEILMGIGIAGMVTTTVLAVRATPKALSMLEQKKEETGSEKLTPVETVKTTWKCYVPSVITGIFSVTCLIGSNTVSARRTAALATVYKISETALNEYREAVVETIGEKKEKDIRDKVAEKKVQNNPVDSSDIVVTSKGNTLCFDTISGQYFRSDIDKIKKVENELNRRMFNEMYISLNELYRKLGLRTTSIGNDLGWNIDDGYLEFYFSSQLAEDGTPCLVLDYKIAPKCDFSKLVY